MAGSLAHSAFHFLRPSHPAYRHRFSSFFSLEVLVSLEVVASTLAEQP